MSNVIALAAPQNIIEVTDLTIYNTDGDPVNPNKLRPNTEYFLRGRCNPRGASGISVQYVGAEPNGQTQQEDNFDFKIPFKTAQTPQPFKAVVTNTYNGHVGSSTIYGLIVP